MRSSATWATSVALDIDEEQIPWQPNVPAYCGYIVVTAPSVMRQWLVQHQSEEIET